MSSRTPFTETIMDLISQLPEPILHCILHSLPTKDAARTSILSKTWRDIQGRYPFLVFNEDDFRFTSHEPTAKIDRKNSFMNYVESRLERIIQQKSAPLLKFCLKLFGYDRQSDSARIDLWLKLVMEKGTKELDLNVWAHCLPPFMLYSDTLTVLSLSNCKFDACGNSINFPKLRKLLLDSLDVDEDFVKRLTFGCPLLESLTLSSCSKLANFQVIGLPELKWVVLGCCPDLSNVEIRSPNVQCIGYGGWQSKPCNLAFDISDTIKQLILLSATITSAWLRQQISKCEELTLTDISGFDGTKISSQRLRKLTIQRCKNMTKVVMVDCPNLRSLVYCGNTFPFRSVNIFKLSDIRIEFCLDLQDVRQREVWLNEIQNFFGKFNSEKEFIKMVISYNGQEDVVILDGLMEPMLPILDDVKDLIPKPRVIISSISNSLGLDNLLNDILSECPKVFSYKTLNVASAYSNNTNFSQVLYEKLSRIKMEANCCEDRVCKCWRHYLCNVRKDITSCIVRDKQRTYQGVSYPVTRILLEWKDY